MNDWMFWVCAVLILIVGGLITLFPLIRRDFRSGLNGAALLLVFLVVPLWLYTHVGTPQALGLSQTSHPKTAAAETNPASMDMNSMITRLQARLAQNPNDADGWVLLARSFQATQRPEQAVQALQTALELNPDNPSIMAELAEGFISSSPTGQNDERVIPILEEALEIDPAHQKALWLMGNAEAEGGNDQAAIDYWETLMAQLEPDRTIAKTVQKQIDEARARLGVAVAESPSTPNVSPTPPGINVAVSADPAMAGTLPQTAVLYVIVRAAGTSAGPPLGVRRVDNPSLPMQLTLTDRDSMMQNRKISSEASFTIQARVSQTGSPGASSGDWQSEPLTVSRGDTDTIDLVLDHRVE